MRNYFGLNQCNMKYAYGNSLFLKYRERIPKEGYTYNRLRVTVLGHSCEQTHSVTLRINKVIRFYESASRCCTIQISFC